MVAHPDSKFPNRLAFVLKLRGDATPDALTGRLENVVTARRVDFTSARELLDAVADEIEANTSKTAPG
jgi:hypothetical protein